MESGGVKASDTEDIKRMVKPFPEERTEIREVDYMVKLKTAIGALYSWAVVLAQAL